MGGFGAELGPVQQGSGEGSGEGSGQGSGRLWCRARSGRLWCRARSDSTCSGEGSGEGCRSEARSGSITSRKIS